FTSSAYFSRVADHHTGYRSPPSGRGAQATPLPITENILGTSTLPILNTIDIRCIFLSPSRPFSNGTPAQVAMSPSPVQSITTLARTKSFPLLVSITTQ